MAIKRLIILFLSAIIVCSLHLVLLFSNWGSRLESWVLDLYFGIRQSTSAPAEVVVISMDESSYRILNVPMDQAWPRALHARLLERLSEFGVRKVVMDILFLDQSGSQADQALATAIGKNPTVLAADSGIREYGSAAGRFTMEELLEPPQLFTDKAQGIALARLPDDFGAVRRFLVPRTNATKHLPALFEAALNKEQIKAYPGEGDLIWYYGPPGTVTTYPYHQILNESGKLPLEMLKDKIVFVGLNLRTELGPSQKDSYLTPFGNMFGVEIQATAAANLLHQQWIKRLSLGLEALLLFVLGLLVCTAIFYLKPHWAGLLLLVLMLSWSVAAYICFLDGFFLPGFLLMWLILPLAYLASTLVYYLLTTRSQQKVEKAFQMYLSPEMARQMRDNPGGLSLGGENLWATALFTDIENFTSITEGMLASEVSEMLNSYFTEVMDVIFDKQGTLIKFIGDAVFALWGAPIKIPDHARMACETALAIQRGAERFNATQRFKALHTRIGINTGPMVVGNLGSARRFDYTAIGDSVNLASRLEGLNKYFGSKILISDSVKKEIGANFHTLQLGNMRVLGKQQATAINLLLEAPFAGPVVSVWQKALSRFRLRDWNEAARLFAETAAQEASLDKSAKLYLSEIERYQKEPPAEDWEGEIDLLIK